MKRYLKSLLIGASIVLLPIGSATASDEKAVAGVAEFVAATTVEFKAWKAAWFCDGTAMQATVEQCRKQLDTLKAATDKATPGMKGALDTLQGNLALLRKEWPESFGVRCRVEWINLISCDSQLATSAIVLRAKLRGLAVK